MKQTLGVAVMRIQVASLTAGHQGLLTLMSEENENTLLFIGDRRKNAGKQNPLPWMVRAQAAKVACPKLSHVSVLWDQPDDEVWSKRLDTAIISLFPNHEVTLYCSRDGFKKHYSGRFMVKEVEVQSSESGTEQRERIYEAGPIDSEIFRAGMIYQTMLQNDTVYSTVDVAILNSDRTQILLGQKPNDDGKWRFPGGFVDPRLDRNRKAAAVREVHEELGMIEIVIEENLGSIIVTDYRYRDEQDAIMTDFFLATYVFGPVRAGDDLSAASWFPIEELMERLVPSHQSLGRMLIDHLSK